MLDLLKINDMKLNRKEIAARCEFSETTIDKYSRRPDFPENVGEGQESLYRWADVRLFLAKKRKELSRDTKNTIAARHHGKRAR